MSVLLFTPVRQDAATFAEVLKSHRALRGVICRVYIDDNDDPETSALLEAERGENDNVMVAKFDGDSQYANHEWKSECLSRIAAIRNYGIKFANIGSHLFSTDADVVLHPDTVVHLQSLNADIATEVYWSQWQPGQPWMPQVWDYHPYGFESSESVLRLREKGTFPVRGGGACTLIDRRVIVANEPRHGGVNYSPIPSLSRLMQGEDRWFCIRAEAAGFTHVADTHYPAFHVYRKEQLDEAKLWYANGAHPGYWRKRYLNEGWETAIRKAVK